MFGLLKRFLPGADLVSGKKLDSVAKIVAILAVLLECYDLWRNRSAQIEQRFSTPSAPGQVTAANAGYPSPNGAPGSGGAPAWSGNYGPDNEQPPYDQR